MINKFPQKLKICYPLIIKVVCADNQPHIFKRGSQDPVLYLKICNSILARYQWVVNDLTLL